MVVKSRIMSPKKPNSARRPVVKVNLVNKYHVTAHIPGVGHNLRKHSTVLVKRKGCRDLPGVNFSCVRGVYDLTGVSKRRRRRSIYGVSLPEAEKTKLRRKYRQV